jgi:hypothetical protein
LQSIAEWFYRLMAQTEYSAHDLSTDAFDAGAVTTGAPAYSRARKNEPAPAIAAQQV